MTDQMMYQPITPFRRARDFVPGDIVAEAAAAQPDPVNKWHVLKDLGTARKALGLSDRSLGVLRALLSFHPVSHTKACRWSMT